MARSEFGKNVLTLMTGSTIAQIVPVAMTPVLTRLFSPDEFGIFAFYMSIATFLAVIATGRYEQAIVLPKSKTEAVNIWALSFIILIVVSSLLFILILFFKGPIEKLLDAPSLNDWLLFIPATVFSIGAYRIMTYWSNRNKRFKGTSGSVITQALVRVSTQMAGGFGKYGVYSSGNSGHFFKSIFTDKHTMPVGITPLGVGTLILSFFLGFLLAAIYLFLPFLKNDWSLLKDVNKNEMKKQAKIYDKFPKINSFHAMSDELKNIGVNSLIRYLFTDMILGFFSMTTRILRAPLAVIGNSFTQVFYQKAAEMHAHGQSFMPLVRSTIKKMVIIAVPIFLTILLFGPQLFEFVLGEKWRIAGVYAQYLTPWLFLNFAVSPILQVTIILNKQGQYFIISLVHNVIILGAIAIGGLVFKDLLDGFLLLSALQIVFYLWILRWLLKISREANPVTPEEIE